MTASFRDSAVARDEAGCPGSPFVLVHGAFYGAWLWEGVRPLLQAAGHEVLTPTLIGLGERSDELSPDIGLGTNVDDVVRFLDDHKVSDAALVAYGYAGMLVPGIAAKAKDRLERLTKSRDPPIGGEGGCVHLG